MTVPAPEADPAGLVALFERHREVHPYGLADLDQPFWARSRWWRRGDAAVGEVGLSGEDPIVYAVSAADPAGTLELLADLAATELPARVVLTGPIGSGPRLADTHDVCWSSPHRKLALARADLLPGPDPRVRALGGADVAAIGRLLASDPDAGDFFRPGLLATGHYRGIERGGALVAMAGVHVVSARHRVAAIGNVATDPGHRRQGLARALVGGLARDLWAEGHTVGLNVRTGNTAAQRLYEALGFEVVIDYDEAEVRRRGAAAPHTMVEPSRPQ